MNFVWIAIVTPSQCLLKRNLSIKHRRVIMRVFLAIAILSSTLVSAGCNSDLRCRRETALLRAEYLDLEDKYYSLLADSGGSVSGSSLDTIVADRTVYQSGDVIVGSGVASQPNLVGDGSDVVYYDSYGPNDLPPGAVTHGTIVSDGTISSGSTGGYETLPLTAPGEQTIIHESVPQNDFFSNGRVIEPEDFSPPQEALENNESSSDTLPVPRDDDGAHSILDSGHDSVAAEFANQRRSASSEPEVVDITVNRSISRGYDSDGNAGDDGLKVLIQPIDGRGEIVEQSGDVTISVIDPEAPQGSRQIGYWEFVQSEAELFLARDEYNNRGILLELPWEDSIPRNSQLTVYVRFRSPAGRISETTTQLIVDPPSQARISRVGKSKTAGNPTGKSKTSATESNWYKGQSGRRSTRSVDSQRDQDRDEDEIELAPADRNRSAYNDAGQSAWKPSR